MNERRRKCRVSKCRAHCCFNVPLPIGFMETYGENIVTPIIGRTTLPPHPDLGMCELVFTDMAFEKNRCPFLRKDYKCNVYEDRPQICHLFGEGDNSLLKCHYLE